MTDRHDLEIAPDGTLRAVYADDVPALARDMGASVKSVERLSRVEWENGGWSVRSERDPELAVRYAGHKASCPYADSPALWVGREMRLALFSNRAVALEAERRFAWDLR